MEFQLLVTCILQEGNAYFLVTKVDDVITLKVPITAGEFILALGVPRCS